MIINNIDITIPKNNEKNPRYIKDEKYKALVESIENFPYYMTLNSIKLDDNNIVIAGNQRLRACIELKWKTIPSQKFTQEDADRMNDERITKGKEPKSYDQYKNEILIKDNLHSGQWDNDKLANEWDQKELTAWGMDIWNVDQVDLENFFEEQNEDIKQNIDKIILEYTPDDHAKVISKLAELGGSKENAIFKALGL